MGQRRIFVAVEKAKNRGKNWKCRGSVTVKLSKNGGCVALKPSKNRGNVAAEFENIAILSR